MWPYLHIYQGSMDCFPLQTESHDSPAMLHNAHSDVATLYFDLMTHCHLDPAAKTPDQSAAGMVPS